MAHILDRIVARKQAEIAASRKRISEAALRGEAENRKAFRGFHAHLTRPGIRIIAEIKRASPSKGVICADLDPAAYAAQYAAGGAAALSVLTDAPFFQGTAADLQSARAACTLPVLRKDFMVDAYQFYEAAAMGVLLIVRILSPAQIRDFLALSTELGLDALVETHTREEIDTAVTAGAQIVGINNRDLTSFDTDVARAADLARHFGPEVTPVAESGITGTDDIRRLHRAGIRCFLVGESIVRSPDPAAFIQSLREAAP
jgi:indole-3-glycerol phosphate synthase